MTLALESSPLFTKADVNAALKKIFCNVSKLVFAVDVIIIAIVAVSTLEIVAANAIFDINTYTLSSAGASVTSVDTRFLFVFYAKVLPLLCILLYLLLSVMAWIALPSTF